jgi:hypothetical protein
MANSIDELIDTFANKLKLLGVPIREEDNKARLDLFENKLPKRLPRSFAAFLSGYSFPSFDLGGVTLFSWDSTSNPYIDEASAPKGSLSELLLPAGYVQIGRPDGGDFDAVCFDLNEKSQNREHRIVQVDHEDILCDQRIRVSGKLWNSFIELVNHVLTSNQPNVLYENFNL